MTSNITLNPGFGGDVVAADDVNGVQHQLVKVEYGDVDSATQVSPGNPLPVKVTETGSIATAIFDHLKANGTGSIEMASASFSGATSGSPVYFSFGPTSGSDEVYRISRIIGVIEVSGDIEAGRYGDIASPGLTNGIELKILSGSEDVWGHVQSISDGHPIKTNIDWAHYCYDMQFFTAFAAGPEFMTFRWTFEKSGAPLRLEGSKSESLVLVVHDDLSSLTSHQIAVQGIFETQLT